MKKFNFVKRATSLVAVTSLVAGLNACGTNATMGSDLSLSESNGVSALAQRPRNGKVAKWTLAIHMAADNNLYSAGLDDINEMEAGLSSPDVNVIVLFDGAQQGDSKIYKITTDKNGYDKNIISEVIDDKGIIIPSSKEIDSGDPKVFSRFSDWVTKNYPAERNLISIWNHGSGIYRNSGNTLVAKPSSETNLSFGDFLGVSKNTSSKSFASDDNGGHMYLKDLNPALALAKQNLGKNLDIFGFDTCLMGHGEAAYQISGLADYLVASEELEPGDGWDYVGFLKELSQKPDMNAAEFSSSIVSTYGKSYTPGGSQSGTNVTLSAIDINALTSGFVPAVNELAGEFSKNLASNKPTIDKVRNVTQYFYNSDCADFGHFLTLLSKESLSEELKAKVSKVREEYNKTVIREAHVGTRVANASGMVMYFPKSTQSYNKRYDDPTDIRFAEQKAWGSFLKLFTNK